MLLAPNKPSPTSLFTLALLAFPAFGLAADAQAASGPAVRVSAASPQAAGGVVAVKVQNRTGAKLAGRVSAKAGKTVAAGKAYTVKGRGTAKVRLSLSAAARNKLAADRRLRLSVTATVKGRRGATASIVVTGAGTPAVPAPAGGMQPSGQGAKPAPAPKPIPGASAPVGSGGTGTGNGGGSTGGGSTGGGQQQPENPNWVAGSLRFSLSSGQITVTQRPLAYLQCSETGGSYRTYGSWEVFRPTGPWTLGAQSQEKTESTALVNQLAGSSPHSVDYQLRSSRSGDTIAGELYIRAAWTNYDYYNNKIVFVNCFGTTTFEAQQG